MAAVRWSKDAVVSIPLEDDLFCLAQMLQSPYMVFFDLFAPDDTWEGVDLGSAPILFHRGVTRQLVKWSGMRKVPGVRPRQDVERPTRWLAPGSPRDHGAAAPVPRAGPQRRPRQGPHRRTPPAA